MVLLIKLGNKILYLVTQIILVRDWVKIICLFSDFFCNGGKGYETNRNYLRYFISDFYTKRGWYCVLFMK